MDDDDDDDDDDAGTEPIITVDGTWICTRAELEPLLSEAEGRGREWLLERQRDARARGLTILDRVPRMADLLALHREMFAAIYVWAGKTRTTPVSLRGVPRMAPELVFPKLGSLMSELYGWIEYAPQPLDTATIARIVADLHHRFEEIHPFQDTNGRTGRVLDHYLLWVTFDLGAPGALPVLEHFPSKRDKRIYTQALEAADAYDPSLIRVFYEERFTAAMNALAAVLAPR